MAEIIRYTIEVEDDPSEKYSTPAYELEAVLGQTVIDLLKRSGKFHWQASEEQGEKREELLARARNCAIASNALDKAIGEARAGG